MRSVSSGDPISRTGQDTATATRRWRAGSRPARASRNAASCNLALEARARRGCRGGGARTG
eukprot:4236947-Alexandrium_andersonii.AAC.1